MMTDHLEESRDEVTNESGDKEHEKNDEEEDAASDTSEVRINITEMKNRTFVASSGEDQNNENKKNLSQSQYPGPGAQV